MIMRGFQTRSLSVMVIMRSDPMTARNYNWYIELKQMLVDKVKETGMPIVLIQTNPQNFDCPYWIIETEKKDMSATLRLLKKR